RGVFFDGVEQDAGRFDAGAPVRDRDVPAQTQGKVLEVLGVYHDVPFMRSRKRRPSRMTGVAAVRITAAMTSTVKAVAGRIMSALRPGYGVRPSPYRDFRQASPNRSDAGITRCPPG